jgi:transcription termination factor Rho
MFEITELKAKTLTELQEVAKTIGLTKTSQLKKLDLVYQILDTQAANLANQEKPKTEKPKRKRVVKKVIHKKPEERSEEKVTPTPISQEEKIEKPKPTPRKKEVVTKQEAKVTEEKAASTEEIVTRKDRAQKTCSQSSKTEKQQP